MYGICFSNTLHVDNEDLHPPSYPPGNFAGDSVSIGVYVHSCDVSGHSYREIVGVGVRVPVHGAATWGAFAD